MGLGLERDDALHGLHAEVVGRRLVFRGKLLDDGSLGEGHVVLVGGEDFARILAGGLLDHVEERRLHLLAVDDEGASKDLVAAMLGVDLSETEDLAVRERASVLLLYLVEVGDLLGREGESLLLVELLEVVHALDGLGVVVDGKDLLVQTVIHALEHGVVVGISVGHREELLYTRNAAEVHILGNLNGICAPRRNHYLPARHRRKAN